MDLTKLFLLREKLDADTAKLFGEFLLRAMRAPDPNRFVQRALRTALDMPEVEVVSVKEGPRR